MLADELDYVVGVDTHRDRHTLAIVAAPNGGVVAQRSVRTNARRDADAVRFAEKHAPGARLWAVEGAGHDRAGFARHLSSRGETVVESGRGPRDERRLRGKDDPLDAIRAAGAALASETLAVPRMGQRREANADRSNAAAASGARVAVPSTSSRRSSSCARSRAGSKPRPRKPSSSSARSSATSACLHRSRSTSPASDRSSPLTCSWPGRTQAASALKPPSRGSPASHPCPPRAAKRSGIDSAAAATANSTAHSTRSSRNDLSTTLRRRTTSSDRSPKARAAAKRPDRSSATSPATPTDNCNTRSR
jgi:hypothetical protein